MEEDVAEMEEVVVNGYFTKNKDSFTGNAVVVSKDELAKVSSNNLLSALQVFDPSFRLKDNVDMGSNPNSMPNFRIRGNSGFGAEGLSEANLKNDPNLPTFILDGYEVDVEKIFDLNMDRIESVTILKDASATAIGIIHSQLLLSIHIFGFIKSTGHLRFQLFPGIQQMIIR